MDTTKITGRSNQFYRIAKSLKNKKARDENGQFLLEGIRVLEVLRDSDLPVSMIFFFFLVLENKRAADLLHALKIRAEKNFVISESMMDQLAPGKNSQGIIAVSPFLPSPGRGFGSADGIYLALENISDPGNLGAVFRTAWAAVTRGILLVGDHTDTYNPKAVRASAEPPSGFISKSRIALIMGSEAHGLSPDMEKAVKNKVSIPLAPGVESLNLAVAAGILLFSMGTAEIQE